MVIELGSRPATKWPVARAAQPRVPEHLAALADLSARQ